MAKSIQLDIPTRDRKAELQKRLAEASADHAGALLEGVELMEALHRRNVLATLRGAVEAGDSLVSNLAEEAARPDSIRALRNMLTLAKIVGKIDPELLETIRKSIPPELGDSHLRRAMPAPSLWKVAKIFWSPPVRRTLMAAGLILAAIGYSLNKDTPNMGNKT